MGKLRCCQNDKTEFSEYRAFLKSTVTSRSWQLPNSSSLTASNIQHAILGVVLPGIWNSRWQRVISLLKPHVINQVRKGYSKMQGNINIPLFQTVLFQMDIIIHFPLMTNHTEGVFQQRSHSFQNKERYSSLPQRHNQLWYLQEGRSTWSQDPWQSSSEAWRKFIRLKALVLLICF